MIEGHIIFNAILYSIVIAYILYINFSAYYQTGTGFLRALVNLFQNWIFRTVYLLIVGFFSLDLFPYGGFVLAILLTIAFLNTNMLMYKKDVEESFTEHLVDDEEKKRLLPPTTTTIQQMQPQQQSASQQMNLPINVQQQGTTIPQTTDPGTLGIQSNSSIYTPPPPVSNNQQQGQNQQMIGQNQQMMGQNQQGQNQPQPQASVIQRNPTSMVSTSQ